jgi:SPP1 gp7 family putative phage head morphogenesis protein
MSPASWTPVPFEEAERFFEGKLPLAPGVAEKLQGIAKSRAFAVAGIAKEEALRTVFESMGRAIREGRTLADFRKDIGQVIEDRGWGDQPWRVDTMFRTNVLTAYAAGQYGKIQEAGDLFPYLQYDAVGDGATRPSHLAMDGKVYAAKDPIWETWFPPNGFNCRCTVRPLSEVEAEAMGVTAGDAPPIGEPDAGFDHNPGRAFFGRVGDGDKRGLPTVREEVPGPADYGLRLARNLRPADMPDLPEDKLMPAGLPEAQYWRAFRETVGIAPGEQKIVRDPTGAPVIVSEDLFRDVHGRSKIVKQGRERYVRMLPGIFEDPDEIWLTPMEYPDGRVVLRRRYVRVWKTPGKDRVSGLAVLDSERGRWTGVSLFVPDELDYIDQQRRGALLYEKTRAKAA